MILQTLLVPPFKEPLQGSKSVREVISTVTFLFVGVALF